MIKDFMPKDLNRLGQRYFLKFKELLRSFGINVLQRDELVIALSLLDVIKAYKEGKYISKGYDGLVGPNAPKSSFNLGGYKPEISTTPPPQAPVELPFASFDQKAIPLRLQYKELPEERQERRQKRAQQ
jgi:hypothetical protein